MKITELKEFRFDIGNTTDEDGGFVADVVATNKGILEGDILVVAAVSELSLDALLMVEIDRKGYIGYLGENADGVKVLNFANKDFPAIKIPVTGPQISGAVIALKRYF